MGKSFTNPSGCFGSVVLAGASRRLASAWRMARQFEYMRQGAAIPLLSKLRWRLEKISASVRGHRTALIFLEIAT